MSNDDLLNRLSEGTDRKRGPWKHVGPKQPPKRRTGKRKARTNRDDTESAVQREVILQAGRLGICLYRQQAGKIFTGHYTIQLAPEGAADLTGMLPNGVRLEVECKKRFGGVQSDVQKKWQEFIEKNGGTYLLVHSGAEFEEQITPILVGLK